MNTNRNKVIALAYEHMGKPHSILDATIGYLRYEIARTLSPRKHQELWGRTMDGERWDDMIDELIVERKGL